MWFITMAPDRLSTTLSALADPTRRAILARLALGETSVTEIAKPFDISLPAVSKHLKVLEHAGLIARGREAQWRPCRLEAAPLRDLADWLAIGSFGTRVSTASTTICAKFNPSQKKGKGMAARSADTGKSMAREFIIARVFDAPRDLVWKAWTEAEHLARWWGPKGFPISVVKLDLRPGGVFLYSMRFPEGHEMWANLCIARSRNPGGSSSLIPSRTRKAAKHRDLRRA